jgi:hypothetical protein
MNSAWDSIIKGAGFAITVGNQRAEIQGTVAMMNSQGGFDGRKIVPVIYDQRGDTADSPATVEQKICTAFTEDNSVFAVGGPWAVSTNFVRCLASHGTMYVGSPGVMDSASLNALKSYTYLPGQFTLDHAMPVVVTRLAEAGFFAQGSRVGLLRIDNSAQKRVADTIVKPMLKDLGHPVLAEAAVSPPNGFQAAVLTMQGNNIDRILVMDNGGGGAATYFMIQADAQKYYPGYGLTSFSAPAGVVAVAAPATQLARVQGVGWNPSGDQSAETITTPGTRLCDPHLRKAGNDQSDPPSRSAGYTYCESGLFLSAVLRVAPELTVPGVQRVVDSGFRAISATSFANHFTRERHDGAAATRPFAYSEECACFKYTGPLRATYAP